MLQDLRHAVRRLIAQPGFTAVALVTLALGIGANTAIFSVASGVLLQPPPYPHPDRLTMVWNDNARISIREDWHSYPNYVDYRDRSTLFDGLAAFNTAAWTLTGDGDPERIPGVFSTANLFDVLGVGPERGRTFSREEDLAGATDVVMISHRFWRQRFGGSEDAVGRSIMLNRNARRIIGIMPEGFAFPSANSDLWVPAQAGPELRGSRGSLWLQIVGRRKANVTVPQAQQDLARVNAAILTAAPGQKGYGVYVEDYREHLVGQVRPAILILLGAVACVLLIACTNVANLLVARGAARQREMALRAAIGAGRGRLVRQLLTESLLIATLGGAAGALIGWLGLRALLAAAPADLPRLQAIVIDGRVLLFTAAIALGTGIAFGLIPALQAARTNPGLALKEGGRGATGAGALARRALVVIEVAIAVVLLVAGGLMVRSYLVVQRVDLGFRTDHVLTARVSLPGARYERPEVVSSFFREFTERAGRLPNIQGAAAIGTIFLTETPNSTNFSIEGRPDFTSLEAVEVPVDSVTPDYVKVMGIRVLAGRFVTDADTSTSPAVVVINDTMARQFWPRESSARPSHQVRVARVAGPLEDDCRDRRRHAPDRIRRRGPSGNLSAARTGARHGDDARPAHDSRPPQRGRRSAIAGALARSDPGGTGRPTSRRDRGGDDGAAATEYAAARRFCRRRGAARRHRPLWRHGPCGRAAHARTGRSPGARRVGRRRDASGDRRRTAPGPDRAWRRVDGGGAEQPAADTPALSRAGHRSRHARNHRRHDAGRRSYRLRSAGAASPPSRSGHGPSRRLTSLCRRPTHVQAVEVKDGVEDERVAPCCLAAIHRVERKEQHLTLLHRDLDEIGAVRDVGAAAQQP